MSDTELPALTPRQQEALDVIAKHMAEHGYPPSVADVMAALGCARNTATVLLRKLADKGYISRTPGKARAIRINERTAP